MYKRQGVCYLKKGEAFDSIALEIQGYFSGTGRIVSEACHLDKTFTYKDHELIRITLPNSEPERNCAVNITLSPEYPREWRSGIEVYSLIGALAVRKQSGDEVWESYTRKLTGNTSAFFHINIGQNARARVVVRGCGIKYDKQLEAQNGHLFIPIAETVAKKETGTCIAEGLALAGKSEFTFTALVAQYATSLPNDPKWAGFAFGPLAEPAIEIDGDEIIVTGSDQVSVVSAGGEYRARSSGDFSYNPNQTQIIRAVTVKGRTAIGILEPGSEEVEWLP